MILYPLTSTHNHTVSDCSGDWSTSDHSNRSWTNVARQCFLLRIDPASEKLVITNLSAVVQWVSCRTIMKALYLQASYPVTEVLSAVNPSAFSWSILSRGSSSAALLLLRPEKGVFCPIPRWTHPSRVAVIALVLTGWVDICSECRTDGLREGTCHPHCQMIDDSTGNEFCMDDRPDDLMVFQQGFATKESESISACVELSS